MLLQSTVKKNKLNEQETTSTKRPCCDASDPFPWYYLCSPENSLHQILFCPLSHIPRIVKKFQDHWEALEEENAGVWCGITVIVMHQVLCWEMKVDGDEGKSLEFYLQCSDYPFLQLKQQGQNLKGLVSNTDEKVSNRVFDRAQCIVFLISCGAFLIRLQRGFFCLHSVCISNHLLTHPRT